MKSVFNNPKINHLLFIVAAILAIVWQLKYFFDSLAFYFFTGSYVKYLHYFSNEYLLSVDSARHAIVLAILSIFFIIGIKAATCADCKQQLKSHSKSATALTIATGFFGYIAWEKTSSFLSESLREFITATHLDANLSGIASTNISNTWAPAGYDLLNLTSTRLLEDVVACCDIILALLFLVKILNLFPWLAITMTTIFYGVGHVRTGNMLKILVLTPLLIFVALYFLKTNYLLPLIFASVITDFWFWYLTPINWYGSFSAIVKIGLIPLSTLIGYILLLTVFPRIMQAENTANTA